ncbi:hypothetical protein C9J21_22040 [Photobacterium phosphoreum]|uniref:TrbI F-type domain-containing protein n=1 Tax=Photobacterium phosphoreum TaxID=659 RepID=UPI000D17D104|nr:TrbI F-type domain-containing protein [Photobacterium phosphoreum]PSW23656.1 hypothetical protein C9J21_22040 [Photobacterium phosphoreum]
MTMIKAILPYLITVIISVCASCLAVHYFQPVPMVSVDLQALLAKQSLRLAADNSALMQQKQTALAHRIDKALAIYSQSTGQVIVVANAVVQGAPDITSKIDQLLQ